MPVLELSNLGRLSETTKPNIARIREDGDKMTLMAPEDLKRHGVPRVSIIQSAGVWRSEIGRWTWVSCSHHPLTHPNTLAYVA